MGTFDEFSNPYHIIVLFDKADLNKIDILTKGRWVSSKEKGQTPDPEKGQKLIVNIILEMREDLTRTSRFTYKDFRYTNIIK